MRVVGQASPTQAHLSLLHRPSDMARQTSFRASWLARQPRADQDLPLHHKTLLNNQECQPICLKGRQDSILRLVPLSMLRLVPTVHQVLMVSSITALCLIAC